MTSSLHGNANTLTISKRSLVCDINMSKTWCSFNLIGVFPFLSVPFPCFHHSVILSLNHAPACHTIYSSLNFTQLVIMTVYCKTLSTLMTNTHMKPSACCDCNVDQTDHFLSWLLWLFFYPHTARLSHCHLTFIYRALPTEFLFSHRGLPHQQLKPARWAVGSQ